MFFPTEYDGWYATHDGKLWSDISGRFIGEGKPNTSGYRVVCRREGTVNVKREVHSILCAAYHGPRPLNHQVNHKNTNKLDNTPSNLEWVTQTENMQHGWVHGLFSTWVDKR